MRDAPSSIEYSVWTCRWVNDFATDLQRVSEEAIQGLELHEWNS